MQATKMEKLIEAEETTHFKADLFMYTPESFTIEEGSRILLEALEASQAIEEEIRRDFQTRSQEMQRLLYASLIASGEYPRQYWDRILYGEPRKTISPRS